MASVCGVLALLCALPGAASARTGFLFLPARGPSPQAQELESDLLSRLERTRRYGIDRLPEEDISKACLRKGAQKVARLVLVRSAKFEGRVDVFDCTQGTTDPPRVAARSSTLKNLASSLRGDFVSAYPLVLSLTVEGGRLWTDAGPEEKVVPGARFFAYAGMGAEERPDCQRVLQVTAYDDSTFRSALEELFRAPLAPEPDSGEVLFVTPLSPPVLRPLAAPVLGEVTARRVLWRESDFLAAASAGPPEGDTGGGLSLSREPRRVEVPQGRPVGTGVSLSFQTALPPDVTLALAWRVSDEKGVRRGYEISLTRAAAAFYGYDGKGRRREILRRLWSAPEGLAEIRLVSYGAWHELYGAGLFLGGFEDYSSLEGRYEFSGPPGVLLQKAELFEIGPVLREGSR